MKLFQPLAISAALFVLAACESQQNYANATTPQYVSRTGTGGRLATPIDYGATRLPRPGVQP